MNTKMIFLMILTVKPVLSSTYIKNWWWIKNDQSDASADTLTSQYQHNYSYPRHQITWPSSQYTHPELIWRAEFKMDEGVSLFEIFIVGSMRITYLMNHKLVTMRKKDHLGMMNYPLWLLKRTKNRIFMANPER